MIICGVIITGKSALKGVKAKGDQPMTAQEKMPKEGIKFQKNVKPSVLRCVSRNKKLPKAQNTNEKRIGSPRNGSFSGNQTF